MSIREATRPSGQASIRSQCVHPIAWPWLLRPACLPCARSPAGARGPRGDGSEKARLRVMYSKNDGDASIVVAPPASKTCVPQVMRWRHSRRQCSPRGRVGPSTRGPTAVTEASRWSVIPRRTMRRHARGSLRDLRFSSKADAARRAIRAKVPIECFHVARASRCRTSRFRRLRGGSDDSFGIAYCSAKFLATGTQWRLPRPCVVHPRRRLGPPLYRDFPRQCSRSPGASRYVTTTP